MSHLHNLFRSRLAQKSGASSVGVEAPTGSLDVAAGSVTGVSELDEIATVEAHLPPRSRLVCQIDPGSPGADRFRLLRMRLQERFKTGKLKKLLITSPLAHDGKSTVLLNLATMLAEGGRVRVLILEADFHRASLSRQLGVEPWSGLSECLAGEINPLAAIRRVMPMGWHLLPAGSAPLNPAELLQSPAMRALLQKLSPHFSWILIDSPPVLPLTDTLSLRQQTDASLLVIRADSTPQKAAEEAIGLIGKHHILGVVLNGVQDLNRIYMKYGYYAETPAELKAADSRGIPSGD